MQPLPTLSGPKTALLLLDYQVDFLSLDGKLPIARDQIEGLLSATHALIAHARREGWVLITVGNAFGRHDVLANWFRRGAAVEGSAGCAPDPRLQADGALGFTKSQGSALTNPELVHYLTSQSFDTLVVAGAYASGCVAATVRDALQRGFRVVVPQEALGDKSRAVVDRTCGALERAGALRLSGIHA